MLAHPDANARLYTLSNIFSHVPFPIVQDIYENVGQNILDARKVLNEMYGDQS
jgi:hypothetical protein